MSIASEAAGRLNGAEFVEIEVEDGLQSLGGSRGFERFGHGLQPSRVVRLERDEFGDGGSPTLWPTTAVGRLKLASSSRGGVAVGAQSSGRPCRMSGSVERLALGPGEGPITPGLAASWHDCSPLRDEIQVGCGAGSTGARVAASVAPRASAERRR